MDTLHVYSSISGKLTTSSGQKRVRKHSQTLQIHVSCQNLICIFTEETQRQHSLQSFSFLANAAQYFMLKEKKILQVEGKKSCFKRQVEGKEKLRKTEKVDIVDEIAKKDFEKSQ